MIQTMLRHHQDVATGTSIKRTYLRRLCDVSLILKQNRPIWDFVARYQLVPKWDWPISRRCRDVSTGTLIGVTSLRRRGNVLPGIFGRYLVVNIWSVLYVFLIIFWFIEIETDSEYLHNLLSDLIWPGCNHRCS